MERIVGNVSVITKEYVDVERKIKEAERMVDKIQYDDNSVLYAENFLHIRDNVIDWIPFDKTSSILEIGGQYGAITTYLLERFQTVSAIESDEDKAFVNVYRNIEANNLKLYIEEIESVLTEIIEEKYDNILIMNLNVPFERQINILKLAYMHLRKGGRLIYSVPNKYGIRCWAQGGTFDRNATTRNKVKVVLTDVGFRNISFYYPYPSVKYATDIYSDDYLPKAGELTHSVVVDNRCVGIVFDEIEKIDEIIRDGLFSEYVNEYLVVAEKEN